MVKITNPLGEVKISKQGEVVYQRKYGEQIRRQVSPKRAIASKAQIDHRNLYRAALAWRKGLSLANRRYLEGYCIANGVVDSYQIPLAWSRFALKLYLEHVHFVPDLWLEAGEPKEGVDQQYTKGDDGDTAIQSQIACSQTFRPSASGKLTKVELKVWRDASYTNFTLEVRGTNPDGSPSETILASQIFSIEQVSETEPGEFFTISLDEPPSLTAETLYALVVYMTVSSAGPSLHWRRDGTEATYPRGQLWYSTDKGEIWTGYPDMDYLFKTYALIAGKDIKKGLLHVRHPALLTVVHKRGELNVNGYDTLSSLDEEYLTKQVGLDVEAGDSIKATTLPGISYDFKVV
ncbi:hypothetical protein ES708_12195 [subsurface metagenome]